MRQHPFTRPTLLAAFDLLEAALSQAKFNALVLRIGLERQVPDDTTVSVGKKAAMAGRAVLADPTRVVPTLEGPVTLMEAVVREAVKLLSPGESRPLEQQRLLRGLALDGFVVEWPDALAEPRLRAALPPEVELPATDDEVHALLDHFKFTTPKGHLDQAIDAHTRGDWAAANSQTRTFFESLFDDIAHHIDAQAAAAAGSSENRRSLLASKNFLSVQRNEWTQDGKNFVNGLFKMLHTEGSHPGLSDEDRSTFRLHVVLVTARTFLRRLKNGR